MYRIFSDECIHKDMIEALKSAGHVVETIYESGMSGATDAEVFDYATKNDLVLFTFDRGFGDIFKFNISNSSGIAIELINSMNKTEIPFVKVGEKSLKGIPREVTVYRVRRKPKSISDGIKLFMGRRVQGNNG